MAAALHVPERRPGHGIATFVAGTIAIATVVTVAVSLLFWLAGGLRPLPVSFGRTAVGVAGLVVAPLGYAALGAVMAHYRPANPTGWLFLIAAVAVGTMLPVNLLVAAAHETFRPAGEAVVAIAWLRNTFATPVVVTVLILAATLFPTGRLPSPRWRLGLLLPLGGGALLAFSAASDPAGMVSYPSIPSPTAASADLLPLVTAARILGVGMLIGATAQAICALVVRYRRGDTILRLQLRWIILAAIVTAAAAVPFLLTRYLVHVSDDVGEMMAAAAQIGSVSFPAATAMAISRHRLFDIDVLLGRTLVYVPLMAILGGLYTASIAFFQRVFVMATGSSSDVAIVLTVLLVAAAFTPVRKGLEALIERRFALPMAVGTTAAATERRGISAREGPTSARPVDGGRPSIKTETVPWGLLMAADGFVHCPRGGRRNIAECAHCASMAAIVQSEGREAVVCAPPAAPGTGIPA